MGTKSFFGSFSCSSICVFISDFPIPYDIRYRWFEFNDDNVTPFDTKQAAEKKEKSSPEIEESDKGDNSENKKGRPSSSNYDEEDPVSIAKAALRNGEEEIKAEKQESDADEKPKTKRQMGKAKGKAKGRPKGKAGAGKKKKQGDDSEEESEKKDLHEQGKKEAATDSGALADHEAPEIKEVVTPADDHADDENGPRRWRSEKAYMLLYKRKDVQFEYPTDLKKLIDARDVAQKEEAKKILWNRVSNLSCTCESSLKHFRVFMI